MGHTKELILCDLPTFQEKQELILRTWREIHLNRSLIINTLEPHVLGQNKHLIRGIFKILGITLVKKDFDNDGQY